VDNSVAGAYSASTMRRWEKGGGVEIICETFQVGMDELVYSVYLSSKLIVIDTQTVDGPGVL
jgi:hypothetical protein